MQTPSLMGHDLVSSVCLLAFTADEKPARENADVDALRFADLMELGNIRSTCQPRCINDLLRDSGAANDPFRPITAYPEVVPKNAVLSG